MTAPTNGSAPKMSTEELLPCPFCNGEYLPDHPKFTGLMPMTSKPCLEELTDDRGWRVCCYGCGVQTWDNLKYTRLEAVGAWNTRRQAAARLRELEAENKRLTIELKVAKTGPAALLRLR